MIRLTIVADERRSHVGVGDRCGGRWDVIRCAGLRNRGLGMWRVWLARSARTGSVVEGEEGR